MGKINGMNEVRSTIPALLERCVREFGDATYVVTPEDRLTYAQADRRSSDVARWLLAQGVGKGARVGLFFANSVEWIVWWLAVSRIGALAVPLSTIYRPAEIAKVVRLADIGLLIAPSRVLTIDVAQRFETAWPELCDQTAVDCRSDKPRSAGRLALPGAPYLRCIVFTGQTDRRWAIGLDGTTTDVAPEEILKAVESEVTPADLAIMVHTSGSTADPKGVLHTHGTLVRQTSTWASAVRAISHAQPPPRILCAMPFFWVGGVLAAMGALHEPVTLRVMPRLDPATALDLAERERATGIVGWPAFTQKLREHPSFAGRDLTSAPMLRDGPLDIAMTDVPDGFPVHRTMTETAGGFAFTDIEVVDDDGQPVPNGTTGELLIRGIGVMAGYNKRERWETFDDDGWYHTGDRVYRRDNDPRLFYVGRTTELIKSAGANVSPLEVEGVITESPDVAQCIVVGISHAERGEEVCAVVVPATVDLDVGKVAAYARDQLSAYKVPTRWVVTTSEQIPTLPSGKFNRKALRESIAAGALR
jgi:acyl-CoA synthetase (AMP-forming)/AMP-acid ligase II